MRTSTKSRTALIARIGLVLALLAAPAAVEAQERKPISFEELLELVRNRVPSGAILTAIQSDCMAFYSITNTMENTLVQAGADRRLLEGLRSICRAFPEGIVQDPSTSWIIVGEPGEWSHESPQTLRVDAGNTVRVVGRAHSPSGVRRLVVNGQQVPLANDPAGGVRFDQSVTATAGMRGIEIVLHPMQGDSLRRILPMTVMGGVVADPDRPVETPRETATTRSQPYSPGGVAVSGLVVPGLAQFRTRNAALGAVFLGAGAGALAAGLLSKETTIRCSMNADPCPESAVLPGGEEKSPYLVPGIAAFVGINVVGALLGYNAAKAANREAAAGGMGSNDGDAGSGLALRLLPSPAPDGAVFLELARLRF